MTKKKKLLICFTASFPFGLKETFLENELPYLAQGFDEILIIPVINYEKDNMPPRNLPKNVKYLEPTVPASKYQRIIKGILNLAPILLYIKDFFRGNVYFSKERCKTWFNSLLLFRLLYIRFNKLKKSDIFQNRDVVLYSYWGEAPIFISRITKEYKKAIRMHRVDFYEEVNDGYLPLRKRIYASSDLLLPISNDIENRLIEDYAIDRTKIYVSRLGTNNEFVLNNDKPNLDPVIRIVSCSRVDPVKRVDLILKCLSKYQSSKLIEWHHFGDGLLFDNLLLQKKELEKDNNKVKIILHGWTQQKDLYKFYENNYVGCFVNVSESEGIPVSIMEAMSFGIPVVATDVGATSEIVNYENGRLLPLTFEIETLLNSILETSDSLEKREQAYLTWRNNYQASNNYTHLVEELRRLIN